MIDLKDLVARPSLYQKELIKRGKKQDSIQTIIDLYDQKKALVKELDAKRTIKNQFNSKIMQLSQTERQVAVADMKRVSDEISELESKVDTIGKQLESELFRIPNLSSVKTPQGRDDSENQIIYTTEIKNYDFKPLPYYELSVYKNYVDQEMGASVMGSRGYYLRGVMARFQKVLFDWAEEEILKHGFEYMYVPLLLNTRTLTGTGHYPDFDGQMYEVVLDDQKSFFLVGSSEPSMISYYSHKHLKNLSKPILMMANTTCFRKEAGSYGKDQLGILRVHQFEKIEMNAICRPEDNDRIFDLHGSINEHLFTQLNLQFRSVEVCSGDLPFKHYRQVDYEAYFPGTGKYREVSSNGSASDYQNRTLGITYDNERGEKAVPWGLNCTGITFRTGLAILEQCQTRDGRVKLPEVLASKMQSEYLE